MEQTLTLHVWQFAIILLLFTVATHVWVGRRKVTEEVVNARLKAAYHELISEFHHSKWLSVGVVGDMLHGLSQGDGIDVDHLRDYNAVQYLQLNEYSSDNIATILEELDEEGDRIGGVNVGNVTGIGDDILPNLHQESARLIRALLAEIEVRKSTEQTQNDTINTLRDELQAQHLRDSLKEE